MSTRARWVTIVLSLFAALAGGYVGAPILDGGSPSGARIRGTAIAHQIACARGSNVDCGIAAAMLREGDPDDLPRAAALGARAARGFGTGSVETDGGEGACEAGDAASCTIAARRAAGDGRPWRVAALHQLACDAGDPFACEAALRARQAARR